MFTEERRQIILSALAMHGSMSVADLSRLVRSSEITVRRDLRALEEANRIVRRRGGAMALGLAMDEPTYLEKSAVAAEEKVAIARTAAAMVQDGDAVMLCAGTTTRALARLLTRKRIMVATNSLLVADELHQASDVEVFLVGGLLRGNIRAVVGGEAEKAISRLRFQKLFLSGNGLTAANGLSTPNLHVASLDRAAVDAAKEVIALVDHTKVGVDSMVQTVPTRRLSTVVTDDRADSGELALLREEGVDVLVADAEATAAVG